MGFEPRRDGQRALTDAYRRLLPARVRLVAPIRAAIYARVSSDQQAERHTIDSQVAALLARAAAEKV